MCVCVCVCVGGGGGGGILASGKHIPNLLTNCPTKLQEIKSMYANITPGQCTQILLPDISS